MILVTGADGFVGRGLLHYMRENKVPFLAATRHGGLVLDRIQTVATGDINEHTDWTHHLVGVTCVVHLAGLAHVLKPCDASQREAFHRVNVLGTQRLALQAAALGVKRFIYLSSVKVNGETTLPGVPFDIDSPPSPRDVYARSKFEAEEILRALEQSTKIQVVIIRTPLVYGPGVKANFASLLRWIDAGLPLPFRGVVDNRRSFVAIQNLSNLIVTASAHPAAGGHVFFASDGHDLSTKKLLEVVGRVLGKPTKLFSMSPQVLRILAGLVGKTESLQRLTESLQVDITHTRKVLDWSPIVTFERALQEITRGLKN